MTKSELYKKVDSILKEDWAPIGAKGYKGPQHEYRGYISTLIHQLLNKADQSKISKSLHEHANIKMGLKTSIYDHYEVAKKLTLLTSQ